MNKMSVNWCLNQILAIGLAVLVAGCGGCELASDTGVVPAITVATSRNFVLYGLESAADGLITRDTTTGLEWLSLGATKNRSYSEVANGFGSFTTVHGFRVATRSEVQRLFQNAGLLDQYADSAGNVRGATDVLLFFGTLATVPGSGNTMQYQSHGMSQPDQPCCPGSPAVSTVSLTFDQQTPLSGRGYVDNGYSNDVSTLGYRGVFLVRNAASPFPPAAIQPTTLMPPLTLPPEPPSGSGGAGQTELLTSTSYAKGAGSGAGPIDLLQIQFFANVEVIVPGPMIFSIDLPNEGSPIAGAVSLRAVDGERFQTIVSLLTNSMGQYVRIGLGTRQTGVGSSMAFPGQDILGNLVLDPDQIDEIRVSYSFQPWPEGGLPGALIGSIDISVYGRANAALP